MKIDVKDLLCGMVFVLEGVEDAPAPNLVVLNTTKIWQSPGIKPGVSVTAVEHKLNENGLLVLENSVVWDLRMEHGHLVRWIGNYPLAQQSLGNCWEESNEK